MGSHGGALRGLSETAQSSVEGGRFGRMFRSLSSAPHGEDALRELAQSMIQGEPEDQPITEAEPEDENPTIPSGFTYLGQFLDHDLTFDPISVLQAENDPNALHDFRTPRLDLDSLYGRGPDDQPYLYKKDTAHELLLGPDRRPPSVAAPRPDLPRNPEGVALIGDPRNDENIIVSQLQSLFLRFHNRVLSTVPNTIGDAARFAEAQRLTRWHYQWVIVHDFLPHIVGDETLATVLRPGGEAPKFRFYTPRRDPYIPVEFSVAAYRFGHSMVRPSYSLSSDVLSGTDATKHRIPVFSDNPDPRANLNGFRPIPDQWGIDWAFFFDNVTQPPAAHPENANPYNPTPEDPFVIPQHSYRIDTALVDPLATLPGPPVTAGPSGRPTRSLAERNLQRGRALGLPSGQAVAQRMGLEVMDDLTLWGSPDPERAEQRQQVLTAFPEFKGNAPLWFYILREAERTLRTGVNDPEAEFGGHHLGSVGGLIVTEVILGLLWHDHHSYLFQDPLWKPTLGTTPGQFLMSDLITFTDG